MMTLVEALEAVHAAGAVLVLGPAGPTIRGEVSAPVVATLRANKVRIAAVLKLRQIHLAMGYDDLAISMIEGALLSGKVREVRIAALPPAGGVQ